MEEFDRLRKLKLSELQKIARDEKVKFQENDTKSMLSSAIVAYRALNATKKIVKASGSAKVDKTKVEAAKKRLELQNEARKKAEADKLAIAPTPSEPEMKITEGLEKVSAPAKEKEGYRYNSKATSIFDCWEKI